MGLDIHLLLFSLSGGDQPKLKLRTTTVQPSGKMRCSLSGCKTRPPGTVPLKPITACSSRASPAAILCCCRVRLSESRSWSTCSSASSRFRIAFTRYRYRTCSNTTLTLTYPTASGSSALPRVSTSLFYPSDPLDSVSTTSRRDLFLDNWFLSLIPCSEG